MSGAWEIAWGIKVEVWPLTPKREYRVRRVEAQDETLPQEGLQLSKDGENGSSARRPEAAPERRVATGENLKKNARQPSI